MNRRVTCFQILVVVLLAMAVFLGVELLRRGGSRSAGYNVILINPNNPAQSLGQWISEDRPKVVLGGVEWTDAIGRYRLVQGSVYVEEILSAARPVVPAVAQRPEADPDASQPEEEAADEE